jgi:hypothetical protein
MKFQFLAFLLLLTILTSLSVSATWTSVLVNQNDTHGDGDILSTGLEYKNDGSTLRAGVSTFNYRAFLDFNTSSIPDGSTINSVILQLTPSNSPSNDIVVYGLSNSSLALNDSSNLASECEGGGSARNYSTSSVWVSQNSPTNFSLAGSATTALGNLLGSNFFSVCLHNFEAEDAGSGITQFYANESFGTFPNYVPVLWVEYDSVSKSTSVPHILLNSAEANLSVNYTTVLNVTSWGVNGTSELLSNITGTLASTTSNTTYLLAAGRYIFTVRINETGSNSASNDTWQVNVSKIVPTLNLSINNTLLNTTSNYSVWENQEVLLRTWNDTGYDILGINVTDNSSGSRVNVITENETTTQNYSSSLIPSNSNFTTVNLTVISPGSENFSAFNKSFFITVNRSFPTWISFSPSFTTGSSATINLSSYVSHPTDSIFNFSYNNGTNTNVTLNGTLATFTGITTGSESLQFNVTDESNDTAMMNVTVTINSQTTSHSGGGSNRNSYTTIIVDSDDPPVFEPQLSPEITTPPVEETQPSVQEETPKDDQLKNDLVEISCTDNCDAYYNNLLDQMEKVKDKVELSKNTYFDNETNQTTTNITLKIKEDLKNFEYVQSVPKCMAIAAHIMEFKEPPTQILKDDPLIAWQFAELKAGTELDLSFDVLGNIPEDCYDLVQEIFYERNSPPNYRNIIIGSFLILSIVVFVIVVLSKPQKSKSKTRKSKK